MKIYKRKEGKPENMENMKNRTVEVGRATLIIVYQKRGKNIRKIS